MPGFKTAFVKYLAAVESLSYKFVRLVAEALGLAPDGLARFFESRERMQHRAKVQHVTPTHLLTRQRLGREADRSLAHSVYQIVKYPTRDEVSSEQGVGPHFDAGFLTFVSPPLFRCLLSFSPFALALSSFPPVLPRIQMVCGATRQSIAIHFSSIQYNGYSFTVIH